MTVSLVARKQGIGASQLLNWRKLERERALIAVSAGDSVLPASELAAADAQIAQLQRMLGKRTMEAEFLKAAVECSRGKSGLRERPCWATMASEGGLFSMGHGALECWHHGDASERFGWWSYRPDVPSA